MRDEAIRVTCDGCGATARVDAGQGIPNGAHLVVTRYTDRGNEAGEGPREIDLCGRCARQPFDVVHFEGGRRG